MHNYMHKIYMYRISRKVLEQKMCLDIVQNVCLDVFRCSIISKQKRRYLENIDAWMSTIVYGCGHVRMYGCRQTKVKVPAYYYYNI